MSVLRQGFWRDAPSGPAGEDGADVLTLKQSCRQHSLAFPQSRLTGPEAGERPLLYELGVTGSESGERGQPNCTALYRAP